MSGNGFPPRNQPGLHEYLLRQATLSSAGSHTVAIHIINGRRVTEGEWNAHMAQQRANQEAARRFTGEPDPNGARMARNCLACDGTGWLHVTPDQDDQCTFCKGKGHIPT